jgi:antitoxin YefM
METLSLSEAKMKLSELVEKVYATDQQILITKNGRPAAVLVSPDEYEGWRETIEIKSDPDLVNEIKMGLSALMKRTKLYTPEELFDQR